MITVAAIDDHPLILYGLRVYLVAEASELALTAESRPGVIRSALDAGALGLVLKEFRGAEAVRTAAQSEFSVSSRFAHAIVTDPRATVRLTAREREVLTFVAHKLIAKKLRISEQTLPSYPRRAGKRYADANHPVAGASELVAAGLEDGHIELRPKRTVG